MVWDIKSALDDEAIQGSWKLLSEYKFKLKELTPIITIRLYKCMGDNVADAIFFEQSHYIHTPVQAGSYITSRPRGDNEAYALHLAVDTLVRYYNDAVSQGHKPSDEWLVLNKDFLNR